MRESGAKTPAKWCSNRVQMGLGWRFLQIHLSPVIQQVSNQSRFVDIIKVFPAKLFKAVNAHGQFFHHAQPPFLQIAADIQSISYLDAL